MASRETESKDCLETAAEVGSGSMNAMDVHYAPLLQAVASEEEEEEDVLEFDMEDAERHKLRGAIELRDLKPPASNGLRDGVVRRNKGRNRLRRLTVVVAVGFLLVVGVIAAAVLSIMNSQFSSDLVHGVQFGHGDWTISFNDTVSESSVYLVDVDGDGLEDVLVGVISLEMYTAYFELLPGRTMREVCSILGYGYPCLGRVIAFRGYDGKKLWETRLRSGLIFITCEDIDVNLDGKPDCIFTGRGSSTEAVDLKTGQIHWVTETENSTWSSHFVRSWTVFRPLIVPDVDGDGVKDILITNSGNQSKEGYEHDRAPGRVIFLSGASGRPLGRYLEIPNSRETYMSVVRHVTANGSSYILFGSGGETVSGNFTIVCYTDLLNYATANRSLSLRTLFRGAEKGVMVAPVLADVTQDGTADILMSAFEGVMLLFDGETLQPLWRRNFPGMESYNTPAPGHYDDDGVLDFMVLWQHGVWDTYDYATVYILSGRDGSVLFQTKSRPVSMNSDLSLKTKADASDLFLVRTIVTHVADKQRQKRHIGHHGNVKTGDEDSILPDTSAEKYDRLCAKLLQQYEKSHMTCSDDPEDAKMMTRLMDRAHAESPVLVSHVTPQQHRYSEPLKTPGRHCHQLSSANGSMVDLCVVKMPTALTGAVGDVDGDGVADLIQGYTINADLFTDDFDYIITLEDFVLTRVSLAAALKGMPELLPMSQQPWRQFMGSASDSVYRTTTQKRPN